MKKEPIANVKLGIFVVAGLIFLVVLLYLIGKNRNLFGSTYELKVNFSNVQGLVPGNNVRFAGIQAGTVKQINIVNDTLIEVTMNVEKNMQSIIKKNAVATIGTEGLVGNRIVNLVPSGEVAPLAKEGDVLTSKKGISTDDMLRTLSKTNADIAEVAGELKAAVQKINKGSALWSLLNDRSIPDNLRQSVLNIKTATAKADMMAANLNEVVLYVKSGKGSVGSLLKDTSFAKNLDDAIIKIKAIGAEADALAVELNSAVAGIKHDVNNGKGTVNALLKDSVLVYKLNTSLDNIQMGTDGFNQNMEAIKHSFLFRNYFKRLEKQKNKNTATSTVKK